MIEQPPVFFYSARTQASNAGDALINRELLRLLRARGEIRAISGGMPPSFLGEMGLAAEEMIGETNADLFKALFRQALRGGRKLYLVLTPGDIFGGASKDGIARGVVFPALRALGVRIIRIGASIGKFTPLRAKTEAWLSRCSYFLGLRDAISIAAAKSYGMKNVGAFPDLAFMLDYFPRRARAVQTVALCLRDDHSDAAGLQSLMASIDSLLAADGDLQVVCVVQVERDASFMRTLTERYPSHRARFVQESRIDALLSIYDDVDIVVTNRLHSMLMAVSRGALPVALLDPEANRKIVGIMSDAGWTQFIHAPGDSLDLAAIIGREPETQALIGDGFARRRAEGLAVMDEMFSKTGAA